MIVLVCNDLPPAVRGKIKLWFLEPKPNVFVSGVKDSLADGIVEMLLDHCPPSSGVLIFKSIRQAPHFQIYTKGSPEKLLTNISGMQLIIEKNIMSADTHVMLQEIRNMKK